MKKALALYSGIAFLILVYTSCSHFTKRKPANVGDGVGNPYIRKSVTQLRYVLVARRDTGIVDVFNHDFCPMDREREVITAYLPIRKTGTNKAFVRNVYGECYMENGIINADEFHVEERYLIPEYPNFAEYPVNWVSYPRR